MTRRICSAIRLMRSKIQTIDLRLQLGARHVIPASASLVEAANRYPTTGSASRTRLELVNEVKGRIGLHPVVNPAAVRAAAHIGR